MRSRTTRLVLPAVAALALVSGCAGLAPTAPAPAALFDDSQFQAPSRPVRVEPVTALDSDLMRIVEQRLRRRPGDRKDVRQKLIDALNEPGSLRLAYDDRFTRTPAEAHADRRGNCLSLALLTAAVAQELGIPIRFHQVLVDEVWSRTNGYTFASGHVHVSLAAVPRLTDVSPRSHDIWTVDFLPADQLRGMPRREIALNTVLAMYFNNRAVELLVERRLDDAYAHVREAARQDPAFAAAYNTLGIVWQQRGHEARAQAAYEQALAIDGDNVKFMGNLLPLLQRAGEVQRAALLAARLEKKLPNTPFYWFDQGMDALERGDAEAAVPLFEREIRRDPHYHEFHFRLAQAHAELGHADAMLQHLQRAAETSTRSADAERYGAKLARLRQAANLN